MDEKQLTYVKPVTSHKDEKQLTYVKPVISRMDDCHADDDLGRCMGGSGADSGCRGGY